MSRQPNELKKRSGAELRAQAAERAAAAADPAEQARRVLANHEHVIESARRSFVDMGRALLAIRTGRLYSGEYSTFSEYCDARWDISEAYANRVINAALVAIKSTPIGVEINSEAQARELADLADEPEQLRQVWDEATRRAAGGRVTAALIKEVRKALDPPEAGDPLDKFPDVKDAIDASIANRSTPFDQPPSPDATEGATSLPRTGDDAGQPEEDHPGTADLGEVEDLDSSTADGVDAPAAARPQVDDVSNGVDSDETEAEDESPRLDSASVDLPQEQTTTGVSVSAPAGDPERSGWDEEQGQAAASVPAPALEELDEEEPPPVDPIAALEALADVYDAIDSDVLGPMLTEAEMVRLGVALGRVAEVVDLLTLWHERTNP